MSDEQIYQQADVATWFDKTYEIEGFQYLRPLEAYPIFLQLLGAQPGERFLDVACGPGHLLKAAHFRGLDATGIDISSTAIDLARRYAPHASLHVGNVESMPFADNSFDLLTCIGALERFFDREQALTEMRRVMATDGRLCFMVRNARAPGWRIFRQLLGKQNHAGHQDAKDFTRWRELFESNGFTVEGVFMDQWMRQKIRKILRGFRRHDFSKPEPVARPLLSMHFVYEYIFILKNSGAD